MPTFALPLAPSTTTTHAQPHSSRVRFSNLPTRKRKRPAPSPTEDSSPEASDDESEDGNSTSLPASTNPLSLTPAEIAQYKLAGLRLDEELPAVESFPHRRLPRKYILESVKVTKLKKDKKGKGKAREESLSESEEHDEESEKEVEEARKGVNTGPQLRLQHLAVLTAILQRCLLEGDIERAKRAWALLIRGQFGGKGIDFRQSGYWGIGAELLMRSLDKPTKRPSYDSDSEDEDEEERQAEDDGWRWGTKEGLEKTKDYYERLILQHPYKRHFHGSVNALDFWPAMVGCEIYGIQAEQKQSLRKLEKEEDEDDGGERSGSESEASAGEEEEDDSDGGFAAGQRRKDKRRKRRAERRWIEREVIRRTALEAAERIAARLDELMGTPPFSDSHNMLRLRGMLALYIGDLSVPAKPIEEEEEDEEEEQSLRRSQRLSQGGKDAERRFLSRQRVNDHKRGKKKQAEEQNKARKFFDRIAKGGGTLEDIKYLSLADGEESHDAGE
ncbi:hypothetical protein BDZ45DRAFT_722577 [Acephala macrosclerotiorum]|nr:hypothetical protein BDZ45DRAFT_722577 [Acephala macrosclerotiorum]